MPISIFAFKDNGNFKLPQQPRNLSNGNKKKYFNRCLYQEQFCKDSALSYDVAVNQWLTSCHKNRMTTRYITLC